MDAAPVPLPKEFVERVQKELPNANELLKALEAEAPVSVRLHLEKGAGVFENEEQVPWCATGCFLEKRPIFTLDPLFHAGSYYPQEAGSMLLMHYLSQLNLGESPICLDLCAAPGGKSTLLLDYLGENGLLISNEIIRNRAFVLRDNLSKWGSKRSIATNNSPVDFGELVGLFDLVLVDAPCSGEGMFRKDKNARNEWSTENVFTCASRQHEILDAIIPTIKNGGYLIYSTCTFNRDENELQIQRLIDGGWFELVDIKMDASWGFKVGADGMGYYAYPGDTKGEGFYSCVLKRINNSERPWSISSRLERQFQKLIWTKAIKGYALPLDSITICKAENLFTMPNDVSDVVKFALMELNCVKWGVRLGEIVKDKLIPNQELAWCDSINSSFERLELNREEALLYLRGEPVNVKGQEGWIIVTFENKSLGWIKALRTRSNNYFPKELRIRMDINKAF